MMNLLDFGKIIKSLRKEKNFTQDELASKLGLSRAILSKLENGYLGNISIAILGNILSLLGYEIDIKLTNPFVS